MYIYYTICIYVCTLCIIYIDKIVTELPITIVAVTLVIGYGYADGVVWLIKKNHRFIIICKELVDNFMIQFDTEKKHLSESEGIQIEGKAHGLYYIVISIVHMFHKRFEEFPAVAFSFLLFYLFSFFFHITSINNGFGDSAESCGAKYFHLCFRECSIVIFLPFNGEYPTITLRKLSEVVQYHPGRGWVLTVFSLRSRSSLEISLSVN